MIGLLAAGCSKKDKSVIAISNEDSGDVSLIDPSTDAVIATIPVGRRPRGMRASPDGRFLYVAVSGSAKRGEGAREEAADGIAVVDVDAHKLTRRLVCGRDPEAFDITPDGKRLFVSNEETAEVSEVDIASGHVTRTIPVGREPEGVTYSNGEIFVTSEGDGRVDVISDDDHEVVRSIATPRRPRAIALRGNEGFVTAENDGVVAVVDRAGAMKTTLPCGDGAKPMGITVQGAQAYVSNGRGKSISVLDLDGHKVIGTIADVGARPWGVAAYGDKLYVAAGPDVAVASISQRAVLTRIPVGTGPWGAVVVKRP